MNEAYNIDCLEYMRTLPDNAFDLCVADPPYGDGLHAEDGGGKGWFTKYNMKAEESLYNTEHRNLRGRFDRYNDAEACSQIRNVERERERARRGTTGSGTPEAGSSGTSATRTRKERSTAGRLLGLRQVANRSGGGGLKDRPEQEEPGKKNTAKKS